MMTPFFPEIVTFLLLKFLYKRKQTKTKDAQYGSSFVTFL